MELTRELSNMVGTHNMVTLVYADGNSCWLPLYVFPEPKSAHSFAWETVRNLWNLPRIRSFRSLVEGPKSSTLRKVPQVPNGFGKSHYYCYSRYST